MDKERNRFGLASMSLTSSRVVELLSCLALRLRSVAMLSWSCISEMSGEIYTCIECAKEPTRMHRDYGGNVTGLW